MRPPLLPLLASLAAATTTLVDILSQSPDHTHLTHLLQRARLIPTLNRLAHATLFAPTNDALARDPDIALLLVDGNNRPDNLQLALRQRLLYHLLNVSLGPPSADSGDASISTLDTILYPLPEDPDQYPGEPGDDPQPSKNGLLGQRPQRIRIATTATTQSLASAGPVVVGVDQNGRGGFETLANGTQIARNGLFVPLDGFLQPPPPLADVLASHPRLSTLMSLMSNVTLARLASQPHITLFAPSNDAFDVLGPLEKAYLTSDLAEDDIIALFTAHSASNSSDVNWLDDFTDEPTPVPVQSGGDQRDEDVVHVMRKGSQLVIDGVDSLESDVFANNGVIHIVPKLLLPGNTFSITVEKALLALNCTKFVNLFRSHNLTHFLSASTGPNKENGPTYTILAASDDVLAGTMDADFAGMYFKTLPPEGSEELRDLLEYHVLSGRWTPQDLRDGMLLGTELIIKKRLHGHHQRVSVSLSDSDGHGGNRAKGLVGFGGSSVMGEPITIGSSIIYLLSKPLHLPDNPIEVAVSQLSLSTFVASTFAAGLDGYLSTYPAVTFFIPSNPSFERLGLVMKYLLLPSSKDSLRKLIEYHVVDEIVYLDETRKGVHQYRTLEGAKLTLRKGAGDKWSNVTVRGPLVEDDDRKEGVNGERRGANVVDGDWLTSTGAIHIVDQVELFPKLDISVGNLVKGTKQTTMLDLIRQANMTWILNGSDPPYVIDMKQKLAKERHKPRNRRSYTLLLPTDTAFTRINLTYYLQDHVRLTSLILQHIIPTPDKSPATNEPGSNNGMEDAVEWGKPLEFSEGTSVKSLLSAGEWGTSNYGDIAFRQVSSQAKMGSGFGSSRSRSGSVSGNEDEGNKQWIVGIKGAQGTNGQHDAGYILEFGRCTPHFYSSTPSIFDTHQNFVPHDSSLIVQTQNRKDFILHSQESLFISSENTMNMLDDDDNGDWVSGGGVLVIDRVLVPYYPTWWQRWSWIFAIVFWVVLGIGFTGGAGYAGYFWYKRKNHVVYERVLGQED